MENILLVDDDTNFRRSLAIGLEALGYNTAEVKGGMEALEFLQNDQNTKKKIQGVVVDARMPGLDGFWLTDQISVMYPSLQVVILSAHAYPQKSDQYTIFTKPIQIPLLAETLEKQINISKQT